MYPLCFSGFFNSVLGFAAASHFASCDVIGTLSSDSTAFRFKFARIDKRMSD
jgi:hypothetical protein